MGPASQKDAIMLHMAALLVDLTPVSVWRRHRTAWLKAHNHS